MNYEFSTRINNAEASAVREILKLMNDPEMISFGGGNPASKAFPIKRIQEISNQLLTDNPIRELAYGITEGDPKMLKEASKFFSRNEDIIRDYDSTMITSGSQQIMDFLAKSMCNEGDVVIAENPTFLGALNSFKSNGCKIKGINTLEDGMDLDELEDALKTTKNVKFIYIIPNFQNPMGICTSLEKRKKILELAKKYNVVILEDNPYGDLRFNGQHIPSIKSFDNDGVVVYAASLSKIIAPGMRIAFVVGPKEIMAKCVICKQVNDVHTNAWAQAVMAEFLATSNMDEHISTISGIYKEKCNLMLSEMDKHFSHKVKWTKPEGGMFIWATLPDNVDLQEFVKKGVDRKVAVVPGNAFYDDPSKECHSFRMNFSMPTSEDIIKGVSILGEIIDEVIDND
ncbi:MAG: PLP-dependent aminotransferase family protein [Thomasclavelia sp.]|nr:PLP-dependent aminotransferase family protein [Thomasclavelia sp.]